MALSKFNTDMNIISALATEPNDVGGLTDAELKAKFDAGPNAIKAYINDTLTSEIDAQKATKEEVQGLVLGQIPDGTITEGKLGSTLSTKINGAAQKSELIDSSISISDAVKTALGLTGSKAVSDALSKLSGAALRKMSATQLSILPDGTEFMLNEIISSTTKAVSFIKLKSNYENSGRILVIRKDAIASMAWNSAGNNAYASSTLDTYLNSTYIGYLDNTVQSQLANVNVPYTVGNGNTSVTTLARKCFALSLTEFNSGAMNVSTEGSPISYFSSNDRRKAYFNGTAIGHHTRSPWYDDTAQVCFMADYGNAGFSPASSSVPYARPAFTLPDSIQVFSPYYASLTDMFGNDLQLPYAKIATGSYTGTGTYGSNNPNSLTFGFTPKLLIIGNPIPSMYGWKYDGVIVRYGQTSTAIEYSGSQSLDFTWSGNTVSWSAGNAYIQLNTSGSSYSYVAIG